MRCSELRRNWGGRMNKVDIDVTALKDRGAYYLARAEFLETLLSGHLSAKQRREAEAELLACRVKALRHAR